MSLYQELVSNEAEPDDCDHEIYNGVCEKCYQQIAGFDHRQKFTICTSKRISMSADYASGDVVSVHGIFKTFSDRPNLYVFPKNLIAEVCNLYDLVTKKSVTRGTQRMGIVAACLDQVLKSQKTFLGEKKLLSLFDIRKKDLSNGRTLLSSVEKLIIPKISDIIKSLCKSLNVENRLVIEQAVSFGNIMKTTHHSFNKSSVASVGASFLYSFIDLKPEVKKYIKNKKITLASFSEISGVSLLTIKNLHAATLSVIEKSRLDASL
jgi:hypothetical protein